MPHHEDEEWWPASSRVAVDMIEALFSRDDLRDRWIEESVSLAEELVDDPPRRHAAALFCIRLYGLLRDIRDSTGRGIEAFEEQPTNDALEAAYRELGDAIAELARLLSRDELLWLEYQRDAESHPWLNAYDHKQESKDVVVDRRLSKLLGARVTFLEYRAAVDSLTTTHGVDGAAASTAKRALPALRRTLEIARRCRS